MYKYKNGQFCTMPPAEVVYSGYKRAFGDLAREQWDEIGWNEAIPLKREAFTTYETQWVKGDDLIYREEAVSAVKDEAVKAAHQAEAARMERDRRLVATDWTQLKDTTLDDGGMVLWQSYRQSLRDVPQQAGFPGTIEWPAEPEKE